MVLHTLLSIRPSNDGDGSGDWSLSATKAKIMNPKALPATGVSIFPPSERQMNNVSFLIISSAYPFSFVASTPYRIAASSISMFISFSDLNLIQYPDTLALPNSFPYVWAKYFLSLIPMI